MIYIKLSWIQLLLVDSILGMLLLLLSSLGLILHLQSIILHLIASCMRSRMFVVTLPPRRA